MGPAGRDREQARRRRQYRRRSGFKADPDGYTLLSAPPPPLVINQTLYPKLNFDPTQFVPIIIISRVPNALVVNPKVTAKTVAEFIAQAKANPGKITSATQGNGTTSHLTSEMFQMMAKVKFQHVPYRGSAPALQDLVAGNVDVMFDNLGVSLALVKGGKLKLLAVATPKRMASLPDVPTIAETLPGFDSAAWFARGRAAEDAAAHRRQDQCRHQRSAQAAGDPGALCRSLGRAVGGTPEETARYMREESRALAQGDQGRRRQARMSAG